MDKEKSAFLQANLIISELKNMILDYEADSAVSKSLSANASYGRDLSQIQARLVRVEAKKQISEYNSASSSQRASEKLLGLSPEDISVPGDALQVDSIVGELVRRLSEHLKTLEDFVEFEAPENATILSVHGQFVEEVQKKRQAVKAKRKHLETSSAAVDSLYIAYYNLLGKTLFLLVHLLNDDKFKLQAQQDQVNVKWMRSRAQAMILKLSVLQHQIAAETYTADAVKALGEIRTQIQGRTQNVQAQLDRATKQLNQYESLGTGFVQLVRQYVSIMESTKDKQWTLSQLDGS